VGNVDGDQRRANCVLGRMRPVDELKGNVSAGFLAFFLDA
jgi:hypothetical protein